MPRLTKNDRRFLEAGLADSDRNLSHVNKIIGEIGDVEIANDQMRGLVGRGLADWRLKPSRTLNSVGAGHIRVTHAGREALRLDTPIRRTAVWLLDGLPNLLWTVMIAVVSAAAGAIVTVMITPEC